MHNYKKIAVFASGRGSNFSAIVKAIKKGFLQAELTLLVCDNPKAQVIVKAKRAGINVLLAKREDFTSKKDFEQNIVNRLKKDKIDLIVLAGFMRMLSPYFVDIFRNKIINIHPALLPAFKGAHAIEDAFKARVKTTGVTVHFVDEQMDHGQIILQEPVTINTDDSLGSLETRIHKVEHLIYPQAIKLVLEGKIKVSG